MHRLFYWTLMTKVKLKGLLLLYSILPELAHCRNYHYDIATELRLDSNRNALKVWIWRVNYNVHDKCLIWNDNIDNVLCAIKGSKSCIWDQLSNSKNLYSTFFIYQNSFAKYIRHIQWIFIKQALKW